MGRFDLSTSTRTVRTIHRLVYRLCQSLITLDVTHLMRLSRARVQLRGGEPAGFEFRFLTADEVRELSGPDTELTRELAERIDGGRDFCFAAFSGERLAGYAWYALGSIEAEHNRGGTFSSGVAMSFPERMAFMYKGFVHPDFRGRGLYGFINAQALDALTSRGIDTALSTADWTNWSALRCCWQLGYEDLGLVWRAGCGRLLFTFAPGRGRFLGVQFGRQAHVVPR